MNRWVGSLVGGVAILLVSLLIFNGCVSQEVQLRQKVEMAESDLSNVIESNMTNRLTAVALYQKKMSQDKELAKIYADAVAQFNKAGDTSLSATERANADTQGYNSLVSGLLLLSKLEGQSNQTQAQSDKNFTLVLSNLEQAQRRIEHSKTKYSASIFAYNAYVESPLGGRFLDAKPIPQPIYVKPKVSALDLLGVPSSP